MKAKLDDLIHYFRENRPHSARVLSIVTVENQHDGWNATKEQRALFQPLGPSGVYYCTADGIIPEAEVTKVGDAGDERVQRHRNSLDRG